MAFFEYYQELQNSFAIEADSFFTSATVVNPSSQVFFYAPFDPGHSGTISALDVYFNFVVNRSASGNIDYSWDYLSTGGSWTAIAAASSVALSAGNNVITRAVFVESLSLVCPLIFRLVITSASSSVYVTVAGSTYYAFVKAIGEVT